MNKKILRVIYLPYKNPWLNLACEEYFLNSYAKDSNEYYLFFYQNSSAIILGKTLELEEEVFTSKPHPPILRRLSGGGSVLHGQGNLNFSFAAHLGENPEFFSVSSSYQKILQPIVNELQKNSKFFVRFSLQGSCDICLYQNSAYRKISGNAQVRKKNWLLHHGTFIFEKNIMRNFSYYLKFPPQTPVYRQKREHKNFMVAALPFHSRPQIERIILTALSKKFSLLPKRDESFFKHAQNFLSPIIFKTKIF